MATVFRGWRGGDHRRRQRKLEDSAEVVALHRRLLLRRLAAADPVGRGVVVLAAAGDVPSALAAEAFRHPEGEQLGCRPAAHLKLQANRLALRGRDRIAGG